jgi:hypothetical protein
LSGEEQGMCFTQIGINRNVSERISFSFSGPEISVQFRMGRIRKASEEKLKQKCADWRKIFGKGWKYN